MKITETKCTNIDFTPEEEAQFKAMSDIVSQVWSYMENNKYQVLEGGYYDDRVTMTKQELRRLYYELEKLQSMDEMY